MTTKDIDISRFLPSNAEIPNLLELLYEETPIENNDFQKFLDLPLNDDYKKRMESEKDNAKVLENKSNSNISDDATSDKQAKTS